MWVLHFDVLSQKQANSYRKSLMFKTCQAGGLTKVRTCGLAQDKLKKNGQPGIWLDRMACAHTASVK